VNDQIQRFLDKDDNKYGCYLCYDTGDVCPGCTGGRIQLKFPNLFMGCGDVLRCMSRMCWVRRYFACEDAAVFQRYYWDNDEEATKAKQRKKSVRAIKAIFPNYEPYNFTLYILVLLI
jgi:hypothetical protein